MTQARDTPTPWWRDAVIYQVYVRSFADGDGDGVGDLRGARARLPHLRDLGADAVWLTPFYASPQADGGYDVSDYRAVDPLFGDLADAEELIREAHRLGLRVIVDVVPNHTSERHPWFAKALAGDPAFRELYHFRPGRGLHGELPPNDWKSVFGGPAWTRVDDGPWYLHLFAPQQPDLNWEHPEVHAEFESVLRFWLGLGVDGFRIDVAHGMVKAAGLPDVGREDQARLIGGDPLPFFDQDGVHEIHRAWRALLDTYDAVPLGPDAAGTAPGADGDGDGGAGGGAGADGGGVVADPRTGAGAGARAGAGAGERGTRPGGRIAVAEAWANSTERLARYVRPDELHQAFNFAFLKAPWDAATLHRVIEDSLAATRAVGAPTTWVLSNHDVVRHPTRYGSLDRARAAALLMLALPGSAYLYQGEELGLPEVADLPDELRQDPAFFRSEGRDGLRDGCRVPLPWTREGASYGFGPGGSWLPQPADWGGLSVAAQTGDPRSTLELYRRAITLRRELPGLGDGAMEWREAPAGVLAFTRPGVLCVVNMTDAPVELPLPGTLLLSSGQTPTRAGEAPDATVLIPADSCTWWAM
ncbi:glycoside hydrolase family 13 protein [Streptomyces sp. NPDC060194]|uniref:glycoside hydrolase family 13 protein n=1 Tax=Streptomyces sp. NPDC060194 TaxID=3347069 RepID=UPI0036474E2B